MLEKWSLCGVLSLGKCKSYVTVCLSDILLKSKLFLSQNQNHCVQLQTPLNPPLLHRQLISVVRCVVQQTGHCDCLAI